MRSDWWRPTWLRVWCQAAALIVVAAVVSSVVIAPAGASGFVPAFVRPNALAPANAPSGATSLGSVSGSQQLQLSVVLPPSNASQLQTLLHNLYDPASAQYQHWLRPGQFLSQFGPSSAALSAVESWLHGAGLNQTSVSGFAVKVSAAASQVSAALGTSFERYQSPSGHVGYLAQATPLVPQSLAGGQIAAILGLDTVARFQPQSTPAPASSGGGGTLLQPMLRITEIPH